MGVDGSIQEILVLSGFWPTCENTISGIFVEQQVRAYIESGVSVKLVVPQMLRRFSLERARAFSAPGLDAHSPVVLGVPGRFGLTSWGWRLNACAFANGLQRVCRQDAVGAIDVIHVHGIRPVGIAAAECRSLDRVPMICTLHGVDTSLLSAYAANRVIRDSVNRFWQRCDRVIVVGNAIVPYARQLGVPEDKIEVIYNGTFLPPRCEERDHHGCVKIGSISNLQELKGIDLNLRALAKIRCSQQTLSWTYEIVGDGPERENLVNLTNELGLNDLVTFHGRVSYEKTMALLQEMDVFSLPSWREALGIVYLEAISRGKPIIGCKAWGAGDVVGDSECGLLVADKNVSELEGALVSLIGNDEQRKLMGQRAFERAKSFSWEINVRKHLDLFDSLIATKTN